MRVWLAMVVFLGAGLSRAQDTQSAADVFAYDLHRLKSFWAGSGAAVQFPGRLLLTSDKLRAQYGAMTSREKFDVGSAFSTELTLEYHVTRPRNSSQNFVFALSESREPVPGFPPQGAGADAYLPLPAQFEGFVLLISDFETAHTGWFRSGTLNKQEVLSRGKVCKLGARKQAALRVLIKFQNQVLNVYFEDPRDASLRLCGQFTDIAVPRTQYLLASASDDSGLAQISVSKWTFSTDTRLEIVPEDRKRPGDSLFAYWGSSAGSSPSADISSFKATALYYYDNSKIYSEELIGLADKNMGDLKQELAGELGATVERLQDAIAVVGREADHLEGLGWVLTHLKNRSKSNINEVLELAVQWLDSIESSIDQTDAETRVIFDLVSKLNLESAAEEMLRRAATLILNLKKLNFKAVFLSKEESLEFLEDEDKLRGWQESLRGFQEQVREKIKRGQAQSRGGASGYGMGVAWLAGASVLGGFAWIYLRLKAALDKS